MQCHRTDSIISSYLKESDPFKRERILEEIISSQALPVIRRVLRQQLGFYVSVPGREANNAEADDLSHEIVTRIIERLRSLRRDDEGGGDAVISDFTSYVSRVARNLCYDYLRHKYPIRHLLKSRIRYMLVRNRDFSLWKDDQTNLICGLREWEGQSLRNLRPDQHQEDRIVEQVKSRHTINRERPAKLLTQVIRHILIEADGPVVLDRLVSLVTRIIESTELVVESLDTELDLLQGTLPDQRPLIDQRLEDRERMRRLWNEIMKLPILQRKVVLLSTIDGIREDLWSLFLESGTVSRSNILEALSIRDDEFHQLWPAMPLDVTGLASYLGISRDQVIRAKYYARQRLKKSLVNFDRGQGSLGRI